MLNFLRRSIRALVKVKLVSINKWLKRYKIDGRDWVNNHSCKPYQSPKRIDKIMEQTIIETRKRLEKNYMLRQER